MSSFRKIADRIPGLLAVGLIFKGSTPGGEKVSMAVLIDGDTEVIQDLSQGLQSNDPRLTKPMKSYMTGLNEVGTYLKARKTEDEDGVTEDMIERAALMLAFPKVAQNAGAMTILKSHLDALQAEGIIEKIGAGDAGADRPRPPRPEARADAPAAPAPARPDAQATAPQRPVPATAAAPAAAAAVAATRPAAPAPAQATADRPMQLNDRIKSAMAETKDDVTTEVKQAVDAGKDKVEKTVTNIAQMADDEIDALKGKAADAISAATPKAEAIKDGADAAAAIAAKPAAPRRGFFRS